MLRLLLLVLAALACQAQKTVYSGVTPSNAHWESEGTNSVSLKIDTRLGLTSTPTYLCRVTSRFSSVSFQFEDAFDPLANVTGACTPRSATADGFKVRLRYLDGSSKNMTVSRASDFRINWIAVTNKHSGMADKKPGMESQAELIKQLMNEEPLVVKGLLGQEYYPMQRNQFKPKPKPASSSSKSQNTTNTTTDNTTSTKE
ncbi:hypothetical protein BASA81_000154 [Batrachochytrium salamandrivorans]|nr:hypothetical protein BASA81_000154 [Batrachochytrium salamandrivorans]